ncbi:MAG: hypothetical protein WCI30_00225 [Clostridia bacterium]
MKPKNERSNNPLASFFAILWWEIFTLVKLNFIFLLCSLPLITIGASWTALTACNLALVKGEQVQVGREFLTALKKYGFAGILLGFIASITLASGGIALYFYLLWARANMLFYLFFFLTLCIEIFLLVSFVYLYPVLVEEKLTVIASCKKAISLAAANFSTGIVAVIAVGILVSVIIYTFSFTVPLLFFLGIAVPNFIFCFIASRAFPPKSEPQ